MKIPGTVGTTKHHGAKMKRLFVYLILPLIMSHNVLLAQSTIPPDEDVDSDREAITIVLDPKLLELAENYVYMLDQLEAITSDYSKYFSKYSTLKNAEYITILEKITKSIGKGIYYKDLKQLKIDIQKLKKSFNHNDQKKSRNDKDYKSYRLAEELSEDILTFEEFYYEDMESEFEEYDNLENLQLYLLSKKLNRQNRYESNDKVNLINEILDKERELAALKTKLYKTEKYLNASEDSINNNDQSHPTEIHIAPTFRFMDETEPFVVVETVHIEMPEILISLEDFPDLADLQDLADVPDVNIIFHSDEEGIITTSIDVGTDYSAIRIKERKAIYKRDKGNYVHLRALIDSSKSISSNTPIHINNPTGDVYIEGWNEDYVLANADITVSAASSKKAEKFIDHIDLEIYNKFGKLYVNTEIPELTDPGTKIVSYSIIIQVPESNPVICRNTYGTVKVLGTENDVTLKTEYSDITVSDISGNLYLVNNDGSCTIRNIEGEINLKNSNGRVALFTCEGFYKIETKFQTVELDGCEGDGTITSYSGNVNISNHYGDLKIKNTKGPLKVTNYEGEIEVASTYGSVTLANISGKVTVANSFANIIGDNIDGDINLSNLYSTISLRNFYGPTRITNNQGSTILFLDDDLNGDASINSTSGSIILKLGFEPDMILSATTINGEIITPLPFKIKTKGELKTLNHTFGAGDYRLDITGDKSSIVISEE